ncbi:retrovirus-related pol polyprotein from transposon TNT 1-94 [Tanacetum coccineum]|uniref:Retrovirus-related pol polyprotein from transposon TNT 1-94 n=1 Tax=Tanacetum coccineum TaxID=301880 RepID=A0ABQ4WU98_9ASTR
MWPSGVMRLTWQLETLMTHFLCCIENTVKDRIMDSGASFHATYCKEELERFKLRSGKVRLADDKTLDIAVVRDAVLKTSFGTSWTLKDVWYISGLKKRLISVGHLDEEGYHVGFRDQQYKVTKSSLVVAHGNKRGNLYMVKVHPEGIGVIINGSGSAAVWFGEAQESFLHNVSEDKETAETAAGVTVEASKMLWADSVVPAYLISMSTTKPNHVPIGLRIPEEEWRGKDTSLTHLKVFGCDSFVKVKDVCGEAMKCTFIGSGSDEMRYSFRDTKSHQNSDTSEGSKNSGSFEDSGRSDEEDSEDGAFSEEGGSETPQERRSTRESRAPIRYSPSANYLLLTENGEPDSYSEVLSTNKSVHWKKAIIKEMKSKMAAKGTRLDWWLRVSNRNGFLSNWKMTTIRVLVFVEDSWNEEPCSDVHQVGDEREVEVLRSFNWPPNELIIEDDVLPERGAIYRTEVCTEDFPTIYQLPNIVLVDNKSDNLVLRSREGRVCRFSVKQAYKDLPNDVGNAHWSCKNVEGSDRKSSDEVPQSSDQMEVVEDATGGRGRMFGNNDRVGENSRWLSLYHKSGGFKDLWAYRCSNVLNMVKGLGTDGKPDPCSISEFNGHGQGQQEHNWEGRLTLIVFRSKYVSDRDTTSLPVAWPPVQSGTGFFMPRRVQEHNMRVPSDANMVSADMFRQGTPQMSQQIGCFGTPMNPFFPTFGSQNAGLPVARPPVHMGMSSNADMAVEGSVDRKNCGPDSGSTTEDS